MFFLSYNNAGEAGSVPVFNRGYLRRFHNAATLIGDGSGALEPEYREIP
jgi:hypothetical protein